MHLTNNIGKPRKKYHTFKNLYSKDTEHTVILGDDLHVIMNYVYGSVSSSHLIAVGNVIIKQTSEIGSNTFAIPTDVLGRLRNQARYLREVRRVTTGDEALFEILDRPHARKVFGPDVEQMKNDHLRVVSGSTDVNGEGL